MFEAPRYEIPVIRGKTQRRASRSTTSSCQDKGSSAVCRGVATGREHGPTRHRRTFIVWPGDGVGTRIAAMWAVPGRFHRTVVAVTSIWFSTCGPDSLLLQPRQPSTAIHVHVG